MAAEQAIHNSREVGEQQASNTMPRKACRCCIERNDVWEQCLTPNGHGCSACKKVFDASAWNARMIKAHLYFNRDLVCPGCAERGYAPGKYDEHQCEECFEKFGSLKFDRKNKYNTKRVKKYRLVCQECLTRLRCSSCKTKYELKYWSKFELKNHSSCLQTKLVCKACRAQGFTPWNLEAYTCQTCSCKFGVNKFDKYALQNFNFHRRLKLQCLQCDGAAEERVRKLRKQLQKSKRKCTCHCRIHQQKCPLTPVIFGERRWPGSDGAISADDRKFLDELNPPPAWWKKAWSR